MPHLYVCQFSNGHIKVGMSDFEGAEKRIAQHVERVACLGVTLMDSAVFTCDYAARWREGLLIERCADAATERFQREWFTGLRFAEVCDWAAEAAAVDLPRAKTFGSRLRDARLYSALTQTELGRLPGVEVTKQCVSHWESDRHQPSLDQLRAICVSLSMTADSLLGIEES